jgi:hypothetical protein
MRVAIFVLLAACAPDGKSACSDLTEAFAALSARCPGVHPRLRTAEDAAEHLFGARDACARATDADFRDLAALTEHCIPALERVECVEAPVLPEACTDQIVGEF